MPGRTETMLATALVVMVVVMALLNVDSAAAGPVEFRHAPSPDQASALPGEARQHRRTKRSYVDSSCKGRYSQRNWDKLSYLCKDCNNVFRQDGLEAECRRGCFASDTFTDCLRELEMDVNLYQIMATSLRGT